MKGLSAERLFFELELEAYPHNDVEESECGLIQLIGIFVEGPDSAAHSDPVSADSE